MITLLLGVSLGFLAGESLVRILVDTDRDGNFRLGDRVLGPHQPELTRLTRLVEKLEKEKGTSVFVDDAGLGWTNRPGATSSHGLYHFDERGIRIGSRATPRRNGPIVALYGDSFTFCNEVHYEDSWGHRLEELLADSGEEHQVLNLGVGGYGMGQAFLRWKSTHPELRPGIVVFGFQPENVVRNVNLIRAFYYPATNLPFSKPRFVLEEDELGIVNVPCLPPRDVLEVLRNPRSWELLPFETFYVEGEREPNPWQRSRLLCLLLDIDRGRRLKEKRRAACYNEGSEAFRLTLGIVQRFHDEVRAAGSRFVIVHFPNRGHLSIARGGRPMPHAALLSELGRRGLTIVDPTPELLELAESEGLESLFRPSTHYSRSGNRVIAEVLAPYL